ncbi:MAG: DUF1673 family protein [Methanoregula sp.]
MHIVETIKHYVGWCPNAQSRVLNTPVQREPMTETSSQKGSLKTRATNWLGLFRNQMLLLAIWFSIVGYLLFVHFGGWSAISLFILGLVVGLPTSAIFGIWYWYIFNKVLHDGPMVLWNRYDKISGSLSVVISVLFIVVPVLVLLGVFPGVTLKMTTAFAGGFVAASMWGILVSVGIWESKTHRQLHYNGTTLGLEKEAEHVHD